VAENQKSSRDRHGRWAKGVSGNPKGRPKKYSKIDHGDFARFMNTIREVNTPEGRIMMTREAAIQHRLYQSAMQGNVHAQIFLSRQLEQSKRDKADIITGYDRLVFRLKEEMRGPTESEALWMAKVQRLLHEVPDPNEIKEALRRLRRETRRKAKRKDGDWDPKS